MSYELLDFGAGRKLERFGDVVVDRPSPGAIGTRRLSPERWKQADASFNKGHHRPGLSGEWARHRPLPEPWLLALPAFSLELRCAPFGHVGVFPEQLDNWRWIEAACRQSHQRLRVLNLFAYTGGSTLAAAAAGAEVTHVDAAKGTVGWGRRNAELSGFAKASIRWIVDDAPAFVGRELKRGRRYDALILDPPTYGHGAKGEAWQIERDLPKLLTTCRNLLETDPAFVLLTCHAVTIDAMAAAGLIGACLGSAGHPSIESGELHLRTNDGRLLPAGVVAKYKR